MHQDWIVQYLAQRGGLSSRGMSFYAARKCPD
jgi:hypothetical protein